MVYLLGSSPPSPLIESESPSALQQDPDSFSIQFATEVSNDKQNQHQFHQIRSTNNSSINGNVVSEISNITSENSNFNILFDTIVESNESMDNLNEDPQGIDVPHVNKQIKKAKVQILEELNGKFKT